MGQTIEKLSERKISAKCIFNNRFVIEICEKVHTHYRNLRIVQSLDDFINTAEGFRDALDRWKKRGCPGTGNRHIELCRKNVAIADDSDTIQINLNKNLYNEHSGEIFSKGADFTEQQYIHLKIRDYRIELSLEDFKELSHAVKEATNRLENSSIHVAL